MGSGEHRITDLESFDIVNESCGIVNESCGHNIEARSAGGMNATVGGSQTGAASVTFTACGQGGTGRTTPSDGGKK